MAFDYTRSAATATRLIAKFGQSVTLRRNNGYTGNSYNPSSTGTTDYTLTAVDLSQRRMGDGVIDTTRTLLVSTSAGVVPVQGESVRVPASTGTWHVITAVRPLSPGGAAVMYECDLET